ncbi:homoserine dehydrogenase [Bradyrhizobium sp. LB1.3]
MVAPLKVGIAGLGTVGAEVVRLIETQARVLAGRSGRGIRVVAVTARSKAKKRAVDLRGVEWVKDPLALAMHPGIDCFVELMGGSGDPALGGGRSRAQRRQVRRHRQQGAARQARPQAGKSR